MTFTCEVISLAEGEVIYDVRADDSKLDSDLTGAEKTTSSKLGKIGGVAAKAGKVAGAAFAAIGSAALAVGTKAVTGAVSFDQAMNQFAASTGIAESELSDYENTLKDIYTNNYGDSFEDVADAMAAVTQQMGDLDQASLQNITESAFTLRDTFGYDINESVRAANTMMTQFGIEGDKAMGLIATGAQNGLDFSGELLDSISEYSVQFAKVGLDADDMFKIMEKGAETGAFNLDKVGDAIKEMSIRVVDGSATTQEGFSAIGLNADEMAAKFAAGGDSAKEAFDQTIQALADMEDPLAQNQAGVALFGTMWEDLGPEVVTQLANIEDGAYATSDSMEELKDIKYDDLGSMMESLGRSVETLLLPLGEALIPLIQQIIEEILPVIEENLPLLTDFISQLVSSLMPLVESLLPPIMDLFNLLLPILIQFIEQILPPIIELLTTLLPPIMKLVETLLPPLIDLFAALITPLAEILSAILPPLIDVINMLLEPIMALIDQLLPPLTELFKGLMPIFDALSPVIEFLGQLFSKVLGGAIEAIMPIIEGVMDVFGGLIDFITGVFSGNWEQAWNGIVDMFKGIFNLIPTIVEGIINGAIAIINGIIWGINQLTGAIGIPAIPEIPNVSLPRFHTGGIVDFAMGEGPALLKDGEMVLTQKQQAELFALANGNYSDAANSSVIVVNSPLYLDGKLITDNVTKHQYSDVMAKRYKG
jgi:phage-related minor tail protein|uniref:Minor tail protein n=1 Tax=Siphoviridae sp. ctfza2 TaxID=2825599 RepID=A0A8S5UY31_9CAUD|nr:MAG TPA: minor tail protein [Siphoviridae sp. ctfza2]